ncbi:hypothetical protein SVEN_0042, partial [Streptomyces venezuelae ATCC 10712]
MHGVQLLRVRAGAVEQRGAAQVGHRGTVDGLAAGEEATLAARVPAQVDADVVDRGGRLVVAGVRVEEHQVAGLQQRRGGRGRPVGGPVDAHAGRVVDHVPRGARDAGLRRVGARGHRNAHVVAVHHPRVPGAVEVADLLAGRPGVGAVGEGPADVHVLVEVGALVAVALRVQVAVPGLAQDLLVLGRSRAAGDGRRAGEEHRRVREDVRRGGTGPAPDDLLQRGGPGAVEGLGEHPHPVAVRDARRLGPVGGVHLETADEQLDGEVGAAIVGERAQADPARAERGVGDVHGPGGGFGGGRAPRLDLDPGALTAHADGPVGAGGHARGEGEGRGQLADRVVDLLLDAQLDRAGGEEGQPGTVVVVRVLVAEGQRVRAGLPGGHLVEPGHGAHVDVGDLVVAQGRVAAGEVGGEGDGTGTGHDGVVGVHGPDGGPAAATGGGAPVRPVGDRQRHVGQCALEVVDERLLVLGERPRRTGEDDGPRTMGQQGDACAAGGDLGTRGCPGKHGGGERAGEGHGGEVGRVERRQRHRGTSRSQARGPGEGLDGSGNGDGLGGTGGETAQRNGGGGSSENGEQTAPRGAIHEH